MIESATGLVLRLYPLTETSLIVRWLTPQFGRLSTVAKGARRAKSPYRGQLDLFHLADFTFQRSRRSDLHTLRDLSLRNPHTFLRADFDRLRSASYATALIEQATEPETPLPGLFDLVQKFLGALAQPGAGAQTTYAFELKLLQELGLSPNLDKARLSEGTRAKVRDWWQLDPGEAMDRSQLEDKEVVELGRYLHGFLIFHLGKIP